MNWIIRRVIKRGERELLPFRLNKVVPELIEYQTYLPIIKTCYEQAGFWHGTGRFQYARKANSRYDGVDFSTVADILDLIVKENGLLPHHEPWIKKIQHITLPTVSMSPYRMYARLYAGLYIYEKDSLQYEFGTTKFWFRTLFSVQVFDWKFLGFLFTKGLFQLTRISSYRGAQTYVRSIRNDTDKKPINPFRGYLIHTDIPNNYPILIGIKKNITTIPLSVGISRLESRTTNQIFLNDFTHIEVPLSKLKITEDFLKEKGIDLQVIPFEFGEMYSSQFSLKELVGI